MSMTDFLSAAASGAEAAPPGWIQLLPFVGMAVIFWFLLIRPQMKRQKEHQQKIAGIKRGNDIVTAGGLVGKVMKVDDHYAEVEISKGVRVKVVKATIGDIVPPGGVAANDTDK